jgi:hypothetical protein
MDQGIKKTPEEIAKEIFGNWIEDSSNEEEEKQGEDS